MLFPFQVGFVRDFRYANRKIYTQSYHAITFNAYGIKRLAVDELEIDPAVPALLLTAKGTRIASDSIPGRETWGIILRTDCLRRSKTPGKVDLRINDTWMSLPVLTPLGPENLPGWQKEMARLRECYLNPIPLNTARLELGIMNILRFIIDCSAGAAILNTPAHELKALLENPDSRCQSLQTLSSRTGYSPEHLRALFRAEFGLSPGAYRNQLRMAEAMECVANSKLSVKEIAYRLGFKHQSHFSLAFRHALGISPREAIAKYRLGKA